VVSCLSDSHRSCESVLPLDSASKDVKNSSLLSDTLEELDNMTETLQKMEENREENRKLLKRKKSLIKKQIRTRSGNLWQWSDCFNVDILNFFKLHVNFINSRRHVMNLLFVRHLITRYIYTRITKPMKVKYRLPVDLRVLL
jgi:hypothetical protein